MSEQEPSAEALEAARELTDKRVHRGYGNEYPESLRQYAFALDAYAAARVAEAVAQERARIVAALNELRSHYREDAERWTKENNWNAAALSDRFGNIVTGCINAIQEDAP
jgi:hypothetical protein